jgi:S1-C subfamily serine protease
VNILLRLALFFAVGTVSASFWNPCAKEVELLDDAQSGYAEAQIRLAEKILSQSKPTVEDKANAIALLYLAYRSGATRLHNQIAAMIPEIPPRQLRAAQLHADILYIRYNHKYLNPTDPPVEPSQPDDTTIGGSIISSGSGTIISKSGLVLTAAHVIEPDAEFVFRSGNKTFEAELLKLDEEHDLALLRIPRGALPHANVAGNPSMKLGTPVFTIGFPNIAFQGTSPKLAKGEISGLTGYRDDPSNWQISLPLQQGNSGGALFDAKGQVVGVVVAKLVLPGTENVSYAVTSNVLADFLQDYAGEFEEPASDSPQSLEEAVGLVSPASGILLSLDP